VALVFGAVALNRSFGSYLCEGFVNDAFEADCTFVQIVTRDRLLIALAKEFVSNVQGYEDGEPKHVARRSRVGCCSHFLIDVGSKLGDVPLIEHAANRVALTPDLHGHDTAHGRVSRC
jgi:hypothetical protein